MFPNKVSLLSTEGINISPKFWNAWKKLMNDSCHQHSVWESPFIQTLNDSKSPEAIRFALAAVWSVNMVVGSYCFPRYVSALAARAEQDAVRYGLLENAWDESGSVHHKSRSHFWLAVRLAQLLGLSEIDIQAIHPLSEAQIYTDEHYRHCASGDFDFALGMICLIEEFTTPEFTAIFNAFLGSCETGMGLKSSEFILQGGGEYFTANIADDERHRLEMPRLVAVCLHSKGVDLKDEHALDAGLEAVRLGAKYSTDLREKFFAGIYDFVQSGKSFKDLVGKGIPAEVRRSTFS